jgi:hypothetical protein
MKQKFTAMLVNHPQLKLQHKIFKNVEFLTFTKNNLSVIPNGTRIAFIFSIPMPGMRAAFPIMGAFASTGSRTGLTPPLQERSGLACVPA